MIKSKRYCGAPFPFHFSVRYGLPHLLSHLHAPQMIRTCSFFIVLVFLSVMFRKENGNDSWCFLTSSFCVLSFPLYHWCMSQPCFLILCLLFLFLALFIFILISILLFLLYQHDQSSKLMKSDGVHLKVII